MPDFTDIGFRESFRMHREVQDKNKIPDSWIEINQNETQKKITITSCCKNNI